MKKFTLLFFLSSIIFSNVYGQVFRAAVRQNGRWGYVDNKGTIVIPPNFDRAYDFGGGAARVKNNGEWCYIDQNGRLLQISPRIDVWRDFTEGMGTVRENDLWGFIGTTGDFAIQPRFSYAKEFSEGLGVVRDGKRWGYVNTNGQIVIQCVYDDTRPFSNGIALVNGNRNGWHYINKDGQKLNTPPLREYKDFSDGYARVLDGKLWGYIDSNGQWAINPQFEEAFDFNDGVAVVRTGGLWNIINKSGQMIGQPTYTDGLKEFSHGLAAVESNGYWGYINPQGQWIINPNFDVAKNFKNGFARVRDTNGKWGFIDTRGNYVVQPQFEDANDFMIFSSSGVAITYNPPINNQVNSIPTTIANNQTQNFPPEIIITTPDNTRGFKVAKKTNTVRVEGKATDDDGIKSIFLNNVQLVPKVDGSFTIDYPLLAGQNNLKVIATDNKGLKAEKIITIERTQDFVQTNTSNNYVSNNGKYYALIIGIDQYYQDDITDLDNPVRDATNLSRILTSNYIFEQSDITLLTNPTRDDVFNELERHSEIVNENDNLLIFYAGHGYWDEEFQKGYWLCSDSERERRGSWFSNNDLYDYIAGIKSKHTLLISDACFSGSIFKTRNAFANAGTNVQKLHSLKSRKAMTSGTMKTVPDKSVFMEYLMRTLTNNPEKFLPAENIFMSLKDPVLLNSPNIPQYGDIHNTGGEGGDFIFIKR